MTPTDMLSETYDGHGPSRAARTREPSDYLSVTLALRPWCPGGSRR